jgi:hypothetical protein
VRLIKMPDPDAASLAPHPPGGKGSFLTRKIGPLPIVVWVVIGVGVWWFVTKKNSATATASQVTDPAGNVCTTINPATGYCQGSAEDIAAAGQSNPGNTDLQPAPGGFTTNDQWKAAALGDLVGNGVSVELATQALDAYLNGQDPTPGQQGYINTAITDIGPPPQVPSPTVAKPPGPKPPPVKKPPPKPPVKKVKVPKITGLTKTAAEKAVTAAHLKASITGQATAKVTSQSPKAATLVAPGSTVTGKAPAVVVKKKPSDDDRVPVKPPARKPPAKGPDRKPKVSPPPGDDAAPLTASQVGAATVPGEHTGPGSVGTKNASRVTGGPVGPGDAPKPVARVPVGTAR